MKHQLNNIRDAAQHIKLSESEKSVMRAHLLEMVRSSKPAHGAPSPYFFFTFNLQRFAMPMAVLLIVALGGTTTYAAQGSLPGGVLYPVKIYVNEHVQEAFAVSNEAKVSFHTSVAQERLKEAEALASEGRLDAEVSSELEANFNEHVAKADTIATTLEESDPASGVDARTTLDSSLAAHGSILAKIGGHSTDEQTKENSSSIASHVLARGRGEAVVAALTAVVPMHADIETRSFSNEAQDASTSGSSTSGVQTMMAAKTASTATVTTTPTTTASQKKLAIQLQKKASAQLEEVRSTYKSDRYALSASTTTRVTVQLSALDDQLDAGKQEIKDKEYDAARMTFTAVIKQSVELNAFIEASKLYNRDFFHNDNDEGRSGDDENKKGDEDVSPGSGIRIDIHL